MPAQRRGAAALDRRHHLELFEAHMAGIGSPPCRTMRAEDIRELECRARHARRVSTGRRGGLEGFDEMIERAQERRDCSVDLGRVRSALREVKLITTKVFLAGLIR